MLIFLHNVVKGLFSLEEFDFNLSELFFSGVLFLYIFPASSVPNMIYIMVKEVDSLF